MEGIGYWIFLLLLYFLSILLKKRRQKAARERLDEGQEESEPEWKPPDFLKNLFREEELPFSQPTPSIPEPVVEEVEEPPPLPVEPDTRSLRESMATKEDLELARQDVTQLRSDLLRRDKKRAQEESEEWESGAYEIVTTRIATTPLVGSFFKDVGTLKQAIVLKEILGKPRALSKYQPGGPLA